VIDSPDARSASDHLPVLATFDLPPRPSEGY
jgi:endonuclease/exonuclease/phosphatase family metal-dependent hydrolase